LCGYGVIIIIIIIIIKYMYYPNKLTGTTRHFFRRLRANDEYHEMSNS